MYLYAVFVNASGKEDVFAPGADMLGNQQIKVQDPTTGQVGLLSPEQAKIAISRGGVKVG